MIDHVALGHDLTAQAYRLDLAATNPRQKFFSSVLSFRAFSKQRITAGGGFLTCGFLWTREIT